VQIRNNFYFQNMVQVLVAILMLFLVSTAFSSVSVSTFDESLVENMVNQKCSDSYTSRVPFDSNAGFDNVIMFNGSYIPLSQVDCDYIDRYEYDVGAYWNIDDLRFSAATSVLSMPIIYSLILSTPLLGLYNTRNSKHHLKKYFRFAEVNVLAPGLSLTLLYVLEVFTRLIASNYFKIPDIASILFVIAPIYIINRQKLRVEELTQKEKKFMIALAVVTIVFWASRLL